MPRNPFRYLVSPAGLLNAFPWTSHTSTSDATVVELSTGSKLSETTSPPEYDELFPPDSPATPAEPSIGSQLSETTSPPEHDEPFPPDSPATLESKLHSPLHPSHPALLRMSFRHASLTFRNRRTAMSAHSRK